MAFSRKARRALRHKRLTAETAVGAVAYEGECAARSDLARETCPYHEGTEEREIWLEAFDELRLVLDVEHEQAAARKAIGGGK